MVFRALVSPGAAVYSPVQASSTEDGGTATVYVADSAARQITPVEEKPSFHLQRSHILIGNSTLMEGTFGSIVQATIQRPGTIPKEVVVKSVKSDSLFEVGGFGDLMG